MASSDTATRKPLNITRKELKPLYEGFLEEDDADGNEVFVESSFGYISDDYTAYFGRSPFRKQDLTPEEIEQRIELLPDDEVYPTIPTWPITVYSAPITDEVFLKRPTLCTAFIGTDQTPKLLLQETEIMEILLRNPHPNIIRYHGCVTARGRIVGLVLDRYDMTLQEKLDRNMIPLSNVDSLVRPIKSAIEHLHSLGLAHNDLNPTNITVDDDKETLLLIDFGSCRPFGETLITAGTVGWIEEEFVHSAKDHDIYALDKLVVWLHSMHEAIR